MKDNKGFFVIVLFYLYLELILSEYLYNGLVDLIWVGLGMVVVYNGFVFYCDGEYMLNDVGLFELDCLGDSYEVNEEVIIFYVKFDFEIEIGDFLVMGNFGV